ncbi:hypothetical protein NHQ30_006611 [Ciborinia camelliae]|nr:hypothetical protein NHQ30_006611 [Ciborinia camelliae]
MTSQSSESPFGDPSGCPELPFLSINVFYAQRDTNIKCRCNCQSIQVDILYPTSYPLDFKSLEHTDKEPEEIMEQAKNPSSLSPAEALTRFEHSSHELYSPINNCPTSGQSSFPFLSLPIEIRLKIYRLLFPPRHHKITTQIPRSGYYFPPTCTPLFAAQSFYPISPNDPDKLTTYKILSANSHPDHPNPTIHTRILSVCRQIQEEAEEVLYGNENSIWDFGVNIEAVSPFWLDRSKGARGWVRNLKIAREIPTTEWIGGDGLWEDVCKFMTREFADLRCLDLTVWGDATVEHHVEGLFISRILPLQPIDDLEKEYAQRRMETDPCEWGKLPEHKGLRRAKVTWWGFRGEVKSFLAKWMLENRLLTEEMVREGEIVQGVVLWNGNGKENGVDVLA